MGRSFFNNLLFNGYGIVIKYRKKFVVFLVVLMLVIPLGRIVLSIQSPPELSQDSQDRYVEQGNLKSKVDFLFVDDPNFSTDSNKSTSKLFGGGRELFFKMMLSILLVIALGAVAIYVSRKVLPRFTNLPGKQIHILETHYLGPKKAVHLIEVDNQRLLIGSTNENITLLAELTCALTEHPMQRDFGTVEPPMDNPVRI